MYCPCLWNNLLLHFLEPAFTVVWHVFNVSSLRQKHLQKHPYACELVHRRAAISIEHNLRGTCRTSADDCLLCSAAETRVTEPWVPRTDLRNALPDDLTRQDGP